MGLKKRFGIVFATALFILVCWTVLLFVGAADPSVKTPALADDEVFVRTTNTASSVNIHQCVSPADSTTDFVSNVCKFDNSHYEKKPTGTSICSYTGALFNSGAGSSGTYNYCRYSVIEDKVTMKTSSSSNSLLPNSNVFYASDNSNFDVGTYCGIDSANKTLVFYSYPPSEMDAALVATFNLGQDIVDALADRLLVVKITPYFITAKKDRGGDIATYLNDEDKDNVDLDCFCYNAGKINHETPPTVQIPVSSNKDMIVTGNTITLSSGVYTTASAGPDCSFIQVSLSKFSANGDVGAAIAEIGIKVTVTPNTGLVFHDTSTYTISGTDRNANEPIDMGGLNYAKPGDIVNFNMRIKSGSIDVYLEEAEAAANGQTKSGIVFHKLFNSGDLVVEYYLKDEDSGDMDVDQSASSTGQSAYVTVKSGNVQNLLIVEVAIRYKNLKSGAYVYMARRDFEIYVDRESPSAPALDANSFYLTYLDENGMLSFYTAGDDADQGYLDINSADGKDDKVQFTSESLDIAKVPAGKNFVDVRASGGSDLTVYYYATYYGEGYPVSRGEKASDGRTVNVNDADLQSQGFIHTAPTSAKVNGSYLGKVCVSSGTYDGDLQYVHNEYDDYGLRLDLSYYDAETGQIAYRKKGVWSIEFFAYDNVGNYNYSPIKTFIKVDITEYQFTINFYVGDPNNQVDVISGDNLRLYYEKVTSSGKLSDNGVFTMNQIRSDGSSDGVLDLYRGDRVCIQVRYSGKSDYSRYILTGFQIGGGAKQNCTDFVYRDYKTVLAFTNADIKTMSGDTIKSVDYTFDVSDTLCKDVYKNGQLQNNRVINLYFKYRISITATGLNQAYSGVSKKIIPYATFGSERLSSLNIKTTYYSAIPDDGTQYLYNQEIGSGVYRMKNTVGELNSSLSDEQFMPATGTYEEGVVYYRKVDNSGSNLPLHTGKYYCACEVTTNINYYGMSVILFTIVPGTPSLSTLYGLQKSGSNQRIEIKYGESLATLDWDPSQIDGLQRFNTNFYVFYEDNTAYGLSSKEESADGTEAKSGILGYFKIGVEDERENAIYKASLDYIKPSAGLHTVKVTFVPIVGEFKINGYEISYYPQYENGNFVRNYDYNTRTVNVSVYVLPSKAVAYSLNRSEMDCDMIETTDTYERVVYTYTGGALGIKYTVLSTYEDVNGNLLELGEADPLNLTDNSGSSRKMTEITYAAIPSMDTEIDGLIFTGDEPIKAGLYAVKVSIVEANCNYTGQKIWYLLINKVALNVTVNATDCDYQYELIPSVVVTTSQNREIQVDIDYEYYYYDASSGLTYEETCQESLRVPDNKLRPYIHTPVDAGTYVVKAVVVDNDYAGEGFATYTIYQVSDGNGYATKAWPSLNESTLLGGCHLCYGQPLAEARITAGTGYYVRYNYQNYLSATRKTTSSNLVPGTFFVASEKYEDWLTRNNRVRSVASREEYILAMRYYTADTDYDGYSGWYMCFAANDSVNFDFLYKQITVKIGYASLNWSRVIIDPIIYETTVNYDYLVPSLNTISLTKKVAYVYSQNGLRPSGLSADNYFVSGNNVYVYVDDSAYNLTLDSKFFQCYEVGSHYIRFSFVPVEGQANNFRGETYDCTLTVRKKTLELSVVSDLTSGSVSRQENGALVSYYKYYDPTDVYPFLAYSGNGIALPSLVGQFIYTKSGKTYRYNATENRYVVASSRTATASDVRSVWTIQVPVTDSSGNPLYDDLGLLRTDIVRKEIRNEDVGATFTVVDYVPVLPAGLYSVHYIVDNANYIGTVDYSFDLKKATLEVAVAPEIVDEDKTLCYGMRFADLRFFGGSIVAKLSSETVAGRYSIDPSQSTLRFGDYNTSIDVLFVYTPDDTENYEVYVGSLDNKKVNKADVSDLMDLSVANYVYAQGHTTGSTDYIALTKDFLKSGYSSAGKDESVDTYEKFIKAFLDYSCVVPAYLEDNYRIEISGSADGRFVGAGTYNVSLIINDTETIYYDDPEGRADEWYDTTLGKYARLRELNYRGVVTVTLTVNKDTAYIVLSDDLAEGETDYDYIVKKTFDSGGASRSVTPVLYDSLGNVITTVAVLQNYYHNGVSVQTPSAIGRYDVRMSLNNTRNYSLVNATYRNGSWTLGAPASYVLGSLVIGVNKEEITFTNLTQTYTETKTVNINFGINNAVCTLQYVRLDDGGAETGSRFIERFPTEAGKYNVHMVFIAEENNGYEDDVIWDQPLVINKYVAKITGSDLVYASYTGRPYETMNPFTEPYGLSIRYSYKTVDEDDYTVLARTSDLGALHAGRYSVLIEIVDHNYTGSKVVSFEMLKAALVVTEAPEFNSYVYHSDTVPEAKAGKGKVYCAENGLEIAGVFSLAYKDISTVPVGRQTVQYTFTPDPDENGYVDYEIVRDYVKLDIEKATYDMEFVSLIMNGKAGLLISDDYTVGYTGDKYEFSSRFDTSLVYEYGTVNSDFHINVVHYYNGGPATPRGIGAYTVTANVVSENYTGTKTWTKQLIIVKGVPVIAEAPTVSKTIKVDDIVPLVSSDFVGGKAVVQGKSSVTIDGVFTVSDTSFTKANLNEVSVTFTPYDTDLYDVVVFPVFVNVIGKDVFAMTKATDEETFDELSSGHTISGADSDWTSTTIQIPGYACSRLLKPMFATVSGTNTTHTHGVYIAISPANGAEYLSYGVSLRSFSLVFKPCVENCAECTAMINALNQNGVLEFEDNDLVPNVGDSVAVRYSLYNNGNVVDYDKLNDMVGNINLGTILRKVKFGSGVSVELIGFYGKKLSENHRLIIRSGGSEIAADPTSVTFSVDTVLTEEDNGRTVLLTDFVSKNYEFATLPKELLLKVYTGLAGVDIVIGNTSKVYDGMPISSADLELSVDNTVMPIPYDSYKITILDANNNISSGWDIGTYLVLIFLKDDEYGYYGETQTTFTIEKRDISEEIRLSKTSDTYASETFTTAPDVIYGGEMLLSSEVIVKYRLSGTDDPFVSTVSDAGLYDLRVTVDSENYYAEKIFSYRILPKTLTVTLDKTSYVFVYGNERTENRGISMLFSNGEDMERVVYFRKEGYSRTTVPPTDAGTYIATIELTSPNYTLSNGTFEYVIRPQNVILEEQPEIQTQVDSSGNTYHIKYGTKLRALNTKFMHGSAVSAGESIPGKFIVNPDDADKKPNAGVDSVTVLFVPNNSNYATVTFTMNVIVASVQVVVEFTNLSASYTGYGVKDALTYVISGAEENIAVDVKFVSVLEGTKTTNPVAAGSYELEVTCANSNYIVTTTTVYGGGSAPVFVVNKASVDESRVVRPSAVPVAVGESLMKSSLNDGLIYYNNFAGAVKGTFEFIQTAKSFKTAGTETVEYRFIPIDNNNFDSYRGTVEITVNKGTATIHWHDVSVTYGTPADFTALRTMFTTSPSNLFYRVSTFDVRNNVLYDDSGDEPLYMNANTYTFTCWIEDDNYVSEVYRFNYVVEKKKIDIDFVNEKGDVVTAYNVLYAKGCNYGFKLYDSNDTTGKSYYLARDAATVGENVQYSFVSRDEDVVYSGRTPPTALGSYNITVTLIHDNYVASATATYKIAKGTVEEINFDVESLSGQIYGSVSKPIIVTVPTDVNYYIIYQGYDKVMPTDVGSYNITVYIDDESYNSKQVSAVFKINPRPLTVSSFTAEDKVFDGTSTIAVTGKLSGVLFSDEVTLTLRGVTADGSSEPGKHGVIITDYKLSGLKAENYVLTMPECSEIITIKTSTVRAKDSSSYMTSSTGFEDGTGIEFYEVDTEKNQTGIVSRSVGASSTIIGYNVTVNGEAAITTGQYKICVEIPEEYRNADFTVDFGGQNVLDPHREGDMYVFNTSVSSGRIVFSKASFKFTYIILIVAAAIVVIAVVLVLVLNPMKKR